MAEVKLTISGDGTGAVQAVENIEQVTARAVGEMNQTWREFTAARMSEYMRSEGGHAGAMRRMSAEWAEYKASGVAANRDVSAASETASKNIERHAQLSASALGMVKAAAAALGISLSAMMVVRYIEEATLLNARYETLGVTMHVVGNNAGYTGAQMDELEGKLRKTGIAAVESRQNLTMMAQAHIDLAHSAELARIAQDAAVIGGINSSEAFSRLVYGIQSAQTEVLRTIGINVNFEDSYRRLGRQLGKNADDLTEYEKVQARVNVVLSKGKDISGAYEAAMGTAGKQLASLKRYTDDLKVVIGSTFSDALLIGVQQVTGGLKDLNDEAGQLQQKGQLQAWGRDAVYVMAFVADAVRYPIIMIRSIGDAIAATANLAISGGIIIGRALKGDFAGAADEWAVMKASYAAYREDINKMWDAPSFQEQARKFYADRETNAARDKALAAEAEKRRMAAAEAARKDAEAKAKAEAAEKKYLDNMKNSLDSIKDYTAAVKELGKQRLEYASQRFSDRLKEDVDLYKEGKRAAEDLASSLRRYGVEVNDVFNQRTAEEQTALDRLSTLYNELKQRISINALSKEAKNAGVEVLKQYRETAQGIIATEQDRYKTLLEGERTYANQVLGLIEEKKKEIKDLQYRFKDANKEFETAQRTALQGSFVQGDYRYLDASLDAYEKRRAVIEKLRKEEAAALQLDDPSRRSTELQKVMDGWSALTGAVQVNRTEMQRFFTDDGSWSGKVEEKLVTVTDTLMTQEETYKQVSDERRRIQEEMIGLAERERDKLVDLYQKSIEKIETFKQKLVDLDNILNTMSRTIVIDLKVNGLEQISRMQSAVTQATQSPYAAQPLTTSDYYESGGNYYWGDGSWAGAVEARASGGPVSPYTTYRVNERGEEYLTLGSQGGFITPAGQTPPAGNTINVPAINVYVQGDGNNKTPQQIAREIWAELDKLNRRRAA